MARQLRAGHFVVGVLGIALLVAPAARSQDFTPLRTRALRADVDAVRAKARVGEVLALRLFDDAGFEAVAERVSESEENGLVWSGRLRNVENGWTVLVVSDDGVMAGVVGTPERLYRIRYAGRGMHAIEEIDPRDVELPADDAVVPDIPLRERLPDLPHSPATADDPVIVDVLFVYTKNASTALLDEVDTGQKTAKKAIKSQVQLAVAVANQALANSGVDAMYRLVGLKKINYVPSGDTPTDLARLRTPNDGHLDKVQKLRDKLGADLVTGVFEKNSAAGLGYQLAYTSPNSKDFAYSTVDYKYLYYNAFAHEAGHNTGLAHDPDNDFTQPTSRSFPYSTGYRDPNAGFVTVMAYRAGCATCVYNIPHFSSPDVRWQGAPTGSSYLYQVPCGNGTTTGAKCGPKTGTANANAALSLTNSLGVIAQHRACKVKCTR